MKTSNVQVSVSLLKYKFCNIASHNKTEIRRFLKTCQLFPVKREYLQGTDSTLPSNKNILILKFKNKLKHFSKCFSLPTFCQQENRSTFYPGKRKHKSLFTVTQGLNALGTFRTSYLKELLPVTAKTIFMLVLDKLT